MRRLLSSLAAAGLALAPAAALAHGDHHGGRELLHVLTSLDHLGPVLLVGLGAALLGRRLRSRKQPSRHAAGRDGAA